MSEMFRDCSISAAKLLVLLRILLGGVDGGDEEPSYGAALSIQCLRRLRLDNTDFTNNSSQYSVS